MFYDSLYLCLISPVNGWSHFDPMTPIWDAEAQGFLLTSESMRTSMKRPRTGFLQSAVCDMRTFLRLPLQQVCRTYPVSCWHRTRFWRTRRSSYYPGALGNKSREFHKSHQDLWRVHVSAWQAFWRTVNARLCVDCRRLRRPLFDRSPGSDCWHEPALCLWPVSSPSLQFGWLFVRNRRLRSESFPIWPGGPNLFDEVSSIHDSDSSTWFRSEIFGVFHILDQFCIYNIAQYTATLYVNQTDVVKLVVKGVFSWSTTVQLNILLSVNSINNPRHISLAFEVEYIHMKSWQVDFIWFWTLIGVHRYKVQTWNPFILSLQCYICYHRAVMEQQ